MISSVAIDDPAFGAVYAEMVEHERERALDELIALVAAHPGSVAARAALTMAHHRCLDSAAAAEQARALLALDPEHSDGLHTLAFSLMAQGDYEGALAVYRRAYGVTRSGTSGTTVGLLLHRLGRLEAAGEVYDAVIGATSPGSLEILAPLRGAMQVLRDQGRPLAADGRAFMLGNAFRLNPVLVASSLSDRDQTTAYHEWLRLVDKTCLAGVLRRGLAADPSGRAPEAFELPAERDAFLAFAAMQSPGMRYIVKPARGSGGQGISVTDDAAAAASRTGVVAQRYIADPYLVDGRKGHLRIYALVTGATPLRAWLYGDGIVRFAPEPYDPDPARLGEAAMHVTNTALHLGHPGLRVSQDAARDDDGSIWSVAALLRRMAADGFDPDAIMGEIGALVAWFLRTLEREGQFARQAAHGPARSFAAKLIGFDILLDAAGRPWLIEMQTNPAARGNPLVNRINGEMFATMFRMTVGALADDAMSAAELAALRADPTAAEQALERRHAGLFRPLIF